MGDRAVYLPKWESFIARVVKDRTNQAFWYPAFMLGKTWSNSLSSQTIFDGKPQKEIIYTKAQDTQLYI